MERGNGHIIMSYSEVSFVLFADSHLYILKQLFWLKEKGKYSVKSNQPVQHLYKSEKHMQIICEYC